MHITSLFMINLFTHLHIYQSICLSIYLSIFLTLNYDEANIADHAKAMAHHARGLKTSRIKCLQGLRLTSAARCIVISRSVFGRLRPIRPASG